MKAQNQRLKMMQDCQHVWPETGVEYKNGAGQVVRVVYTCTRCGWREDEGKV